MMAKKENDMLYVNKACRRFLLTFYNFPNVLFVSNQYVGQHLLHNDTKLTFLIIKKARYNLKNIILVFGIIIACLIIYEIYMNTKLNLFII